MRFEKKTACSIIIALFLITTLGFQIHPTGAGGTIYIRPDGTVDPPTASIHRDGDVYTFTDDIYEPIVIEKDNVIVDGNNFRLQGAGTGKGFDISHRTNVTIVNTEIVQFNSGMYFYYSDRNTIIGNTILNSTGIGVYVDFDSDYNNLTSNVVSYSMSSGIKIYNNRENVVSESIITHNTLALSPWTSGIWMEFASYCNITGNTITHNRKEAIYLYGVSQIRITDNTVTDNSHGIGTYDVSSTKIVSNIISNNTNIGIDLRYPASWNIIDGNSFDSNYWGIRMTADGTAGVRYNNIINNNFTRNDIGLQIDEGVMNNVVDNIIYHNRFVANIEQVRLIPLFPGVPAAYNSWDDGYPSGGNSWSDYTDVDLYSGPNQDQPGSDGIWDHPYVLDDNNVDRYPFVFDYTPLVYTLTINSATGGTTDPPAGVYPYNENEIATVTAFPDTGYYFSHWQYDGHTSTDNPISIMMSKDYDLTPVFFMTIPEFPIGLALEILFLPVLLYIYRRARQESTN